MLDVYAALENEDLAINILLQVHDELVFEVRKEDLAESSSF